MNANYFTLTPEAQEQMNAVRRKYDGTAQWMKAPNWKKYKRTERQWLQVRTLNFKKWFGIWNYDEKELIEATKIGSSALLFDYKDTKQLKQWLRDNFVGIEVRVNSDGRIIGFSSRGLGDSLKRRGK